ncbi:MAG: hypothetical protein ACKVQQ_22220, partial [Burkholderiales bacterium]
WLLFGIAFLGASVAAAAIVHETRVRRDREADLLAIGQESRRAIAAYHQATPQAAKELPQRLEDLVLDRRGAVPRRHLRRIYPDPFTGRAEWGIVAAGERILGVYSLAPGTPVKRGGFPESDAGFANAARYADWRFLADVAVITPKPAPGEARPAVSNAPNAPPGQAAAPGQAVATEGGVPQFQPGPPDR